MELAAMKFIFRFMVNSRDFIVTSVCDCVKERMYEFSNVLDNLVFWLVVYNICISHIVRWGLVWDPLEVYVKFLGLFHCRYKCD